MKHKKERYTLIPLFEKRVSDFADEQDFSTPVYSFNEKTGEYTASINRDSFTMLFRYYPDNESSMFQMGNKTKGIVLNSFIPFCTYNQGTYIERFDSLRVLYVFNNKEPYYCLHDIFNIFDIKDFSSCEEHCIFSERTFNKAFDRLFDNAVKYDSYIKETAENEELQQKLFYNFKYDTEVLLPSRKIKNKTISEQRDAMDSVLAMNTARDMAGYNKNIYNGLPEKALKCLYKEQSNGNLTVFEKRYCQYLEENLDRFRERKQTDFAKARSFCHSAKIIIGAAFVVIMGMVAYLAIILAKKIAFGSDPALVFELFGLAVCLQALGGLFIGFAVYPIVSRLLLRGNKEKLDNVVDFQKHSFWERLDHKSYCCISIVFICLVSFIIISGISDSPIFKENYIEKIDVFSSENKQYAYDEFEYYVVAGYYDEDEEYYDEDEEYYDDGTRELVLKFDEENYYFSDWLYPDELEKYIIRIEANGGTVQYKDNLEEVDEYFRSES